MKTALVLINNENGILARFVYGQVTDVVYFNGFCVTAREIEEFRTDPARFKEQSL